MIVGIHQPHYLPWLPYCDKVDQCDLFVYLDTVQFQKNGLQNRNQVKSASGPAWLTVPVHASLTTSIADTEIADQRWGIKHIRTIEMNYARAPWIDLFRGGLKPVLEQEWHSLPDLNIAIMEWLCASLQIKTQCVRASQLNVAGKAQELVINICKAVGADVYLSGKGASSYQDEKIFRDNGIELCYLDYHNRSYPQCHPAVGFVPDLSALDLVLNTGSEARSIMLAGRVIEPEGVSR